MYSRPSDNSSLKIHSIVNTKLKHLICTNCKHAFSFRGAHQFRGKTPFLLECGHAICEICVKTSPIKSCRSCQRVYQHNPNEQANFSVNLYLLGLITSDQSILVNNSEPNIEFQQPAAARFRKSIMENLDHCSECGLKADYRCYQCEVFFCGTCYSKIHGRALQSHVKISVAENASDIYNFLTSKCEFHPNEIVQFHCNQCDAPVCTHCVFLSHQGHTIISQSEKINESRSQIEDTIDKLGETLQRVKLTEKKLAKPITFMDTSQDSETDREKIEARLIEHFTYLHGVLQNIETRFITELQQRQNYIANNISVIKEQLKEQKDELENAILLANAALKSDCAVNVTAVIDKLEQALNVPCHLVHNSFSEDKIELHIDESIVDSLVQHCSISLPEISCYSLAKTDELPDNYEIEPIIREEIPRPALLAIKPAPLNLSRSSLIPLQSVTNQNKNGSLVEGSSEAVNITHIKDPSCFYTQSLCRSAELIQLHNSLAKQAGTSPIPTALELNKMYLVQYGSDMKWYRGRVKTLYKDSTNGEICDIFYVDYGNTECSVPIRRMRNMALQSSLVPIMARQCRLYDIVPSDGQWGVDANKAMYEMIEGNSHTIMHVFEVHNDIYHVDITKNSFGNGDYTLSVRDALIFLEYGSFVSNETLRKTSPLSVRKFFEEEIAIENTYDVRATHIESPDCIYVQKIGDGITHLMKLTKDMMDEYGEIPLNKGIIYTPQIGMPCAALYSDGTWYRGIITNLLGNRKVEVFFVDYGDKREYEYDAIRRLHYKFMTVTALAFKISLKDVAPLKNNEWSIEAKEFITQNLVGKFLKIFVFSKGSNGYKVSLYIPMENTDLNFNALLAKGKLALSTGSSSQFVDTPKTGSKKRKKRGFNARKSAELAHCVENEDLGNEIDESDPFRMQVRVSQVDSPDCIYVNDVKSTKAINKMMEDIQRFYNKYKSAETEDWEKGSVCIAYSAKDKLYHRSKILEIISPENVLVLLYDIGITETVAMQDLQSLHPKFSTLSAKTFKIKLAGILPCGGSTTWLSSSTEMLSDLINENQHSKFYISKAAGTENDAKSVELWVRETRTEGPLAPTIVEINSINRRLVEKGVALPVRGYKDELDKVLSVELRQQLLQSEETNMTTEIEWVVKKEASSCPSDVTTESRVLGSSDEMSESDRVSEHENSNADADIESDGEFPIPPPLSAWIPAVPIIDDKFCAVATNVDQDCIIYLHSRKQNSDTLAHIDAALDAHFSGSKPKACDMVWAPNDLCIAQYHADKKWYRAKVLEVLENDEIKVTFVDYGNVDECKLGTLRKRVIMGHIPIQATRCIVRGLIPDTPDGKWTIPDLDVIHALVVDKRSDVTVLERNPEHLVVSMTLRSFKNMDLLTYLRFKLNFKIRDFVVEVPNQEECSNIDSGGDYSDNADVIVEENVDGYVPRTIAEPSVFNLGLNLEPTSRVKIEAEICNEIATGAMDISDDQIPDDKNSRTSRNSDVIVISDDCKPTSLRGMQSFVESINVFSTPQNEKNHQFLPRYMCIDVPDDVQILNLNPIHVDEPTVFYARLDKSSKVELLDTYEKQFELMTRHMQLEAYNPPKLGNIRLYSPCCAKYTVDNKWYRAMIIEIAAHSKTVRVQYVDYGNSEYQPIDKIHSLADNFLTLPMMSLKCRLWKVRVSPDIPTWRRYIDKFDGVFYQGVVRAKIKDRSSGMLDVELYSDEDCTKLRYESLLEEGLLEIAEE